jgi:hypothetical protein
MELFENKKRYEWNATSRRGRVESYLAEDETNIYFESGRFILKENFGSQLSPIDEEMYQQKLSSETRTIETPLPPDPINWESLLGNPEPLSNSVQVVQVEQKVVEQNPIKIILDKQKRKEKLKINVEFEFEIPSKKVLDLLDVMFEREEIIEEIIKSSIGNLETELVMEKISNVTKRNIESFFNNEEKDDLKNEMSIGR